MFRLVATATALLSFAYAAAGEEASNTRFPSPGPESGVLTISAAADLSAMAPLIIDFQRTAPGVTVDYLEFTSDDLDRESDLACTESRPFGDLLISSAVDHLIKYANDGCAVAHVSDATRAIPNTSTYWRNEVFGFTFEPAVIVYNSELLDSDEVPRSRNELADLLRSEQSRFQGKVTTYDLRLSGTGYLLAFLDAQQNPTTYGRLLESMSRVGTRLACCTDTMLTAIASGEAYLGYNVLGSYAYAAARKNPSLRIVLPRDYTLILHRAAVIPRAALRPDLAAQFLDYLLSWEGQAEGVRSSFFFSRDGQVPEGVDGPSTLMASGVGRTVTIRPTLLAAQDQAQRRRFIADWSNIMAR